MYNTGNPIGSTAPKDFSDNTEITDRYVNDVVNETTRDRFGRSRLTIHGQQENARRSLESIESNAATVIANLGFFPPVDYTTGLTVDSRNFTVTYNGVVYAAQPSAVPFTTGAWNAAQWYPIQNVLNQNNLLVFDDYASAEVAAATLPDGQVVVSDADEVKWTVTDGSLSQEKSVYNVADYGKVRTYTGRGGRLRVVDSTGSHWWVRRGDSADNSGTVLKDGLGRSWEREYSGRANAAWFGADGSWNSVTHSGVDSTVAFEAMALSGIKAFYLPPGSYKLSRSIVGRFSLFANSPTDTSIFAYGCDAFVQPPHTNFITFEGFGLYSYEANNAIDPKSYVGINSAGISGQTNSWVTLRNVFLRGWAKCISLAYTWNSVIDNVDTQFCTTGVELFGQTTNNSISNSRILANTGQHSILFTRDGSVISEGLMIVNSLIGSGQYGFSGYAPLSLNLSNCVVDLVQDTAFDLTDPEAFSITNSWVYAKNIGIRFRDLGSLKELGASITGCHIHTTELGSTPIRVGGANNGVSIAGGSLKTPNGNCIWADGNKVSAVGVDLQTLNAFGVLFVGTDSNAIGCTGNTSVSYHYRENTPKSMVAAGGVVFPQTPSPSGDARTLDDYAEVEFTPSVEANDDPAKKFTATSASGHSVKIGKLVHMQVSIAYSDRGAIVNSFAILKGLPHAPEGSANAVCSVFIEQPGGDSSAYYGWILDSGVLFRKDNKSAGYAGGAAYMTGGDFPASGVLKISATYIAKN